MLITILTTYGEYKTKTNWDLAKLAKELKYNNSKETINIGSLILRKKDVLMIKVIQY